MDPLISEMSKRLLAGYTPSVVRSILVDGHDDPVWKELEASGFLDLLSSDESELTLADAFPLMFEAGCRAAPCPLGETMLVRSILGPLSPVGPIAFAYSHNTREGQIFCSRVPRAHTASWILVPIVDGAHLLPVSEASETRLEGSAGGGSYFHWERWPVGAIPLPAGIDWLAAGALVSSVRAAGAIASILEMTLRYAGDRIQFGRAIGNFQAVQHQISTLCEGVVASRMAAEVACAPPVSNPRWFDRRRIATAKIETNRQGAVALSVGHAVHGAISMSEEFDFYLFGDVIRESAAAFGSEIHWARILGGELIDTRSIDALSYVRELTNSASM